MDTAVNWAFCIHLNLIPCVEIFLELSFLLPGPVCKISQQADERKRFILADKSWPLVLRGRRRDILQATAQILRLFHVIDASATTRASFLLLVAVFYFLFFRWALLIVGPKAFSGILRSRLINLFDCKNPNNSRLDAGIKRYIDLVCGGKTRSM